MLAVCTWLWGDKYGPEHVIKLKNGLDRHLKQPFRFLCVTERERVWTPWPDTERHTIRDPELLAYKGCFVRLRMFDYGWQQDHGIDDRLVCMDLDTIVTGELDPLFDRPDTFVILTGANSINPCPYNGSLMMLRPGHHGEIWSTFSIEAALEMPCYEFPDDQEWLSRKLPLAGTWQAGRKSGVYAFRKPGWPPGQLELPKNARMVVFPGRRQPSDFTHLEWVRRFWR